MLQECYIAEVEKRGIAPSIDAHTKQHIGSAANWLTSDAKVGLLLCGNVGNGKTTLMQSIITLMALVCPRIVKRVTAIELSEIARASPQEFKEIKSYPFLAIDDVGVEPDSVKSWGNEISPFVEVIYQRYDKQLFTIATTNLNSEDLGRRYGVRVADRFTEMFDLVGFTNKSYRK